jgi:hypothetical protein
MSLAIITAATLIGILLLGLLGDVLIGATIAAAVRLTEAAAKPVALVTHRIRHRPAGRAAAEPRATAPIVRAENGQS